MTNREKFAEEILDIVCSGDGFAVLKNNGKLVACNGVKCYECLFNDGNGTCAELTKEWSYAEYIEKPKISKNDRDFLSFLSAEWIYMTRSKSGALYAHNIKPKKGEYMWTGWEDYFRFNDYFKVNFPMVKWEDEEPWLVEDLKKLEVIESYENN